MSDKMPQFPEAVGSHFVTRVIKGPGGNGEGKLTIKLHTYTEEQMRTYARKYAQQWREDAARLDWIEADEDRTVYVGMNGKWCCQDPGSGLWDGDDLRAAIDAARAAREGGDGR